MAVTGAVAVNIELPRIIKRFAVHDGQAVPLGTLMTFSGPLRVKASGTPNEAFAGIATEEKTAGDGILEIALAQDGVWDLYCHGSLALAAGELVRLSGPNAVEGTITEATLIAGGLVGKSHEDVGAATPEVIRVMVGQS